MGIVGTGPGGGKVTATGLTPGVIKRGTTVTLKQGNKVVSSVQGVYLGPQYGFFRINFWDNKDQHSCKAQTPNAPWQNSGTIREGVITFSRSCVCRITNVSSKEGHTFGGSAGFSNSNLGPITVSAGQTLVYSTLGWNGQLYFDLSADIKY